jgi:hypothetical protein
VVLGQTLSGKTQKVMHPSTAVMNPHGGKLDVAIPLRNDAAWRWYGNVVPRILTARA